MVHLGSEPQAGFDEPLRLLSDCHRRIEHFLGILLKVAREQPGGQLNQEYPRDRARDGEPAQARSRAQHARMTPSSLMSSAATAVVVLCLHTSGCP